jgi:glycosyltransferase involved in cell wall biosynthesis
VIIPAYNTAPFISEALQSVFAQTFRDFEVIVINDGSPDTEELKAVIAPNRRSIVYIEQENRGLAGARNTGIHAARGEFVAFLDSDDCWLPELLNEQLSLLRQDPMADLVYADAAIFGEHISGTSTSLMQSHRAPSEVPVTFESLLAERCQVIVTTAVARKQVLLDAGLFDEALQAVEDYDLWLRLAHRGARIRYQRKVLARYRIRSGSLSSSQTRMYQNLVRVLEKAGRTLDLPESTGLLLQERLMRARALLDKAEGEEYLSAGQLAEASDSFERANAFLRSTKLRAVLLGLRVAPRLTARGAQWYKGRQKRAE